MKIIIIVICAIVSFQSCIKETEKEVDYGLVTTFDKKNQEYKKKYFLLSIVKFNNDSLYNKTDFYIIHKNSKEVSNVQRLILANNCYINNGKLVFNFNPEASNLSGEQDLYELTVENSKYKFSSGYYDSFPKKIRKQDKRNFNDLVLNKLKFNVGDTVYGVFSVDRIIEYDSLHIDSFTVYGEIRTIVLPAPTHCVP